MPYEAMQQHIGPKSKNEIRYREGMAKIYAQANHWRAGDNATGGALPSVRNLSSLKLLEDKYGPNIYLLRPDRFEALVRQEWGELLSKPLTKALKNDLAELETASAPNPELSPPYPGWPAATRLPLNKDMVDDERLRKFFGPFSSSLTNRQRQVLYSDLVLGQSLEEMVTFFGKSKPIIAARLGQAKAIIGWS